MNHMLTHEHLEKLKHELEFLEMTYGYLAGKYADELDNLRYDHCLKLSSRIVAKRFEIEALEDFLS